MDGEVLRDRELEHEPAALAVLGDVAEPGVEVILDAEPGDVEMRYPISSLTRPAFDPAVGDSVYVAADDDTAPAVQPTKPADGRIWIRGEVTARAGRRIEVAYGIERYRMPTSAAPTDWSAGPIAVEVRVDGTGRAAIQHVLVDGRPVDGGTH